jgi:hypothetical protein
VLPHLCEPKSVGNLEPSTPNQMPIFKNSPTIVILAPLSYLIPKQQNSPAAGYSTSIITSAPPATNVMSHNSTSSEIAVAIAISLPSLLITSLSLRVIYVTFTHTRGFYRQRLVARDFLDIRRGLHTRSPLSGRIVNR